MTNLREQAKAKIEGEVQKAAALSHSRNYHRLHVWRDGDVTWSEYIDSNSDTIDSAADHFCAVRSVAHVGTGSISCNCDFCGNVGPDCPDEEGNYFESIEAMELERASQEDNSWLLNQMKTEFGQIPTGYFDDEK